MSVTRIGVLSDTHGKLRADVIRRFDGMDRIVHAGDVGSLAIIAELGALAPVTAVWGNTDGFEIRHELHETATLEVGGLRLMVVHGHQLGSPEPARLRKAYPEPDIIVYGHTHRPTIERVDGHLILNPGAAGPARFDLEPSIAILEIGDREPEVTLLELDR